MDGVGNLYEDMRRGSLLPTEGRRVTDLGASCFGEGWRRWGRPFGIATDSWRISELKDACGDMALPAQELRRQGWRDGGQDVRAFQRLAG